MAGSEDFIIKGPPVLDIPNIGLGEYLYDLCGTHKVKTALIDPVTKDELSYEELNNEAVRIAIGLQRVGVRPGDVIGICGENRIHYPTVVLAGIYIGGVIAPYNNSYTLGELEHAVSLTKPKVIFCTEATRPTVTNVAARFGFVEDVILIDENAGVLSCVARLVHGVTHHDVATFRVAKTVAPKEEVVLIMCSSGTTGLPKGVMLTHYNVMFSLHVYRDPEFSLREDITHTLGFLPPFHVFGLISVLFTILKGITTVVLEKFDPLMFLRCIQDYKIKAIALVPPILNFLAKHPLPGKYNLSSLEEIGCGAAPASRETENAIMRRYPNMKAVRQGYGMTETTLGVLKVPLSQPKPGSVGIAVPGIEVKVIHTETNKVLGPNQPGELCIRGPLVMKGYIGDPTATAATIDQEGWLHTGDIAYYDEEHWFYIVDRLKELIKYKGFQVPPAELEALLMTHPAVLDAAVIGVPDEEAGELPKAFIVKKTEVTEKEIQQFVAVRVSKSKHLRGGVEFVESIPKNPSGKILRRVLRSKSVKVNSKL